MGYYSDVAIALTDAGVKSLKTRLDMADEAILSEVKPLLETADRHFTDPSTKAEAWYWDSIKWYIDDPVYYPEINFMQELIQGLDEEDYRFIRVGEDYDDTEVYGDFTENPFDLVLARGITISAP